MRTHLLTIFSCFLALVLISACTTGFKLDPGNYTMTLKLRNAASPQPKKVFLETQGDLVTIKNVETKEVIKGTLKKNQFYVQIDQNGKTIEFSGKLIMNNKVQGNAKQSSADGMDFNADFTLVKVAE